MQTLNRAGPLIVFRMRSGPKQADLFHVVYLFIFSSGIFHFYEKKNSTIFLD